MTDYKTEIEKIDKALWKFRFDENVTGYAVISKNCRIIKVAGLNSEIITRINALIKILGNELETSILQLENTLIEITKISNNYFLVASFDRTVMMGMALAKTAGVQRMLAKVNFDAIDEQEASIPIKETHEEIKQIPGEPTSIIPKPGRNYFDAKLTGTDINMEIRSKFGNTSIVVISYVDGSKNVEEISKLTGEPIEWVLEVIGWAISKEILSL